MIRKDNNVYGDSVNIASRIESMGIPNSILVSESVRNNIKNQPGLQFQLLGEYEFKNVSEPMAVYALDTDKLEIPDPASVTGKLAIKAKKRSTLLRRFGIVALIIVAILAYDYFEENSKSKETEEITSSIAVLPFTNLSQDADQDYLTAGFTSEVNHQLSKIESLSVISQTLAQQLVRQAKTAGEIAKELNVNYILEGTIQKAGDRTRLITNLTRMTDNQMIWSEEFDLDEVNLIDAQIQVSTGIAEKLPLNVSEQKITQLQKIPTSSPLAYEFYLKALDSFNEWVALQQAYTPTIRFLEKAISLDNNFAQAHALLARVYQNSSRMVGADYDQASANSLKYAHKAIALDSLLPDPYVVLGQYYNDRESGDGLKWFSKANELDPRAGLFELFQFHIARSEYISAFEYAALKVERDPISPYGYIGIAEVNADLGNLERAMAILEHLLDQGFTNTFVTGNLINIYSVLRRPDDAMRLIDAYLMPKDSVSGIREKGIIYLFSKEWNESEPYYLRTNNFDMDLGLIHLNTGREASADTLFQAAISRRLVFLQTNATWYLRDLSRIYAAMGDFEKTYEYLEILDQRDDLHYGWIHIDPFFDKIRDENRFQDYYKRIETRKEKLRRQIQNMEKELEFDI